MRRAFVLLTIVSVTAALIVSTSQARKSARGSNPKRLTPATSYHTKGLSDLPLEHPGRVPLTAPDTTVLAEYTFDTGGAPDAMGWVSVDRTAQVDTVFHVADATELDGGTFGRLLVLEGSQSLWCGVAAQATPLYCGYASLPGYGNDWDQRFESTTFNADTINVSWKIRWDSEPDDDETYVEYMNFSGDWVALPINGGTGYYDDYGEAVESHQITGDIGPPGAGSTRIRFRFKSLSAWSDQDGNWDTDGACIVDSILVTDGNGVTLCYEDFEGESLGDRETNDGLWHATTPDGFGDFAALYDAFWVLQEDPCYTSISTIWGFFDDPAISDYACDTPTPHPEQGAVRYGPNSRGQYLRNEIWSPWIPFTDSGSHVVLEFDVYRDLALDAVVFYTWAVRSWVAGCPTNWVDDEVVYHGLTGLKDWYRASFEIARHIDPAAESVQLAVGVVDLCDYWCGIVGTGDCHSHAPLFDNVKLFRIETTGPVWGVRDGSLFQDNFATDGTAAGTVRVDMAQDILPSFSPTIIPGDSMDVTVYEREVGLGTDTYTGCGPAVYLHVKDVSPAKSGLAIQAPEDRFMGSSCGTALRYPMAYTGGGWTTVRFDSVFTGGGGLVADRYCVDLNDDLYTPGDTIYFYFSAKDGLGKGNTTYWSRYTGTTDSEAEVLSAPMEMTCLPANALTGVTDILYVDGFDQLGAQPYFEAGFEALGITPDRYDVRAAESGVGNRPGGRVVNVFNQLIPYYHTIIWNTGDLPQGCIGDGTGYLDGYEKSDDATMLFYFLSYHPDSAAVYFSGDDLADEWANLTGSSAAVLRTYMNYTVVNSNHVSAGLPISPLAVGQPGSIFDHSGTKDSLIAFGGCPSMNDFDVLGATGASSVAAAYSNDPAKGAVLVQETVNSSGKPARVALSGFSYHEIRDVNVSTPANVEHLLDILNWSGYVGGFTPVCQVQPTSLDFDTTFVDSLRFETFTIKNIGGGVLSGIATETCSHYTIVYGASYNLSTGQSKTITVRYKPNTIGTHTCTIETGLVDCPNVLCTGVADLPPVCVVEPTSIDFGAVSTKSYLDTTFTIVNLGGWKLTGSVVDTCSYYSIESGGGPYSLAAGESLVVAVRFTPTTTGTQPGTIETGDAACSDVDLTGRGVDLSICSVTPDRLGFGDVTIGESRQTTFVITNVGGGTLSGTVSSPCGDFVVTDPPGGSYSLGAGAWQNVTVEFTPSVLGVQECRIDTDTPCDRMVFVADGTSGLQVLDAADAAAPILMGSYDTPDIAYGVFVRYDYAYVADLGGSYISGLQIFDIVVPSSPVLVGSYDTPAGARDVFVIGGYAYVADASAGLHIYDVTDPSNPDSVASYDTPSGAMGIVVVGDYAYVADYGAGLRVIDVSDPTDPTPVGGYVTPDYAMGVFIQGDYAYLGVENAGLQVIDITVPTSPTLEGSYDTPGLARSVYVSGNTAYVADRDAGLQIIDVTDPANPDSIGNYDTPGSADDVVVSSDYAYVSDMGSGVQVIDVSNPASPVLMGSYDTPGNSRGAAVINGGDVVVTGTGIDAPPLCEVTPSNLDFGTITAGIPKDTTFMIRNAGGGLLEINVSEVCPEFSIVSGGGPDTLATGDSVMVDVRFEPTVVETLSCLVDLGTSYHRMVYVADRTSGIHIFDAKDPTVPTSEGAHATPDEAYGVFISGHNAYVADGLTGLQILSIVDPSNPVSLGSCALPHSAQDVHVVGDYAYVTAYNAGLRVLDVRDPTSPTEVGSYVIPGMGFAYGLDISGTRAFVAASDSGLVVIDISNPANPTRTGGYDTSVWAWDVVVSGDYAYIADGWGLVIVDVSGPGDPSYVGDYQIGPWSYGVCVSGDYAYLGNSIDGLRVIDVSDPANPVSRGTCDTPGFAFGVVVEGYIAFVADGDYGLQVIDVSDPYNPNIVRTLDTPGTATRLAIKNGGDVVLTGIGKDPGTGIQELQAPTRFALYQNIPNPFNPTTTIRYDVPAGGGKVTLRVYDVRGRLVRTLVDAQQTAGEKRVVWYGRNNSGNSVATGVYFYRMRAPGYENTRKMILLQ